MLSRLSLYAPQDIQNDFARFLRARRERLGWSRRELAERSSVPAATIKRFELEGEISLRQLLLLWQSLDDLKRLRTLTKPALPEPKSIQDVLDG